MRFLAAIAAPWLLGMQAFLTVKLTPLGPPGVEASRRNADATFADEIFPRRIICWKPQPNRILIRR